MARIVGVNLNSITFRLSFLFAMSAIILLTGTGAFLYRFLEVELMKRDHEELLGKVDLFRHQLSTVDTPGQIVAAPSQFHDVIIGHPHLRLALLDAQGNTLLTSAEWKPSAELLEHPVDIDTSPDHASISMPSLAQPYHAVAAWGALGDRRTGKVLIVLALDADDALSLLIRYKQTLLLTMILSGMTAAFLGFLIVRRGLRPLHAMAETASEISASHLQKRLNVADAPAELKELAGAFNAMLGRLHNSFDRLSDFSSDLAHELRTPINNLMGQTQVALSRTRNAGEYQTVLESNLEEYERLARMIRDMLFLAQADNAQSDSAQESLHAEQLDLRAELDKIAEFYQMAADERGVRIIPSGSGAIIADRILVQRAIGNLISNALQHSPQNSEVHADVSSTAEAVELRVSNYGQGIPDEHLERIFDRFYRINNARSRADTGSGLGLAIVKSIMELHGGHVSVDSQANQLTTFKLHFPKQNPAVSR
ncbi:MAG TPA: heavy metal sensor histidine kinase [Gallionellaceae bacterium]|nr:heavy metal sensor histidine kinase [Gallionellaceae bacterium]